GKIRKLHILIPHFRREGNVRQHRKREKSGSLAARRTSPEAKSEKIFFDLATDLFCVMDSTFRMATLNRAWEKSLGLPRKDLQGRSVLDRVHPEDHRLFQQAV